MSVIYEWRACAGDSYEAMEDYTLWSSDEDDARHRVGSLHATPPYALHWLERRRAASEPTRVS